MAAGVLAAERPPLRKLARAARRTVGDAAVVRCEVRAQVACVGWPSSVSSKGPAWTGFGIRESAGRYPLRVRGRSALAVACWFPPPSRVLVGSSTTLACHATELVVIANARAPAAPREVRMSCSAVCWSHPLQLPGFEDTACGGRTDGTTRKRLRQ